MAKCVNFVNLSFPLNHDCAQKLFEFLDLDDCMSLAEAYEELQPMADRVFKRKFNELTVDCSGSINRILYHAGPTLQSLTLCLKTVHDKSELVKIGETCTQLRKLNLSELKLTRSSSNPFANIITDKLEVLTLDRCAVGYVEVFSSYKNLKSLNLLQCENINANDIRKCFKENPGITNFYCDNLAFAQTKMLQLLPKLERLTLRYSSAYMRTRSFSKLKSLRRLTLDCLGENANGILADLAKCNSLEHLVLLDIIPDENTFKLVKKLDNLQTLVVTTDEASEYPDPSDLPANLQSLEMGGFRLFRHNIRHTAEGLHRLQNLHLSQCNVRDADGNWADDFEMLFRFVARETRKLTHRQLTISIEPLDDHHPPTIGYEGGLRITNIVDYRNLFQVWHPGVID